jgi:FixJ family two-component response regulator
MQNVIPAAICQRLVMPPKNDLRHSDVKLSVRLLNQGIIPLYLRTLGGVCRGSLVRLHYLAFAGRVTGSRRNIELQRNELAKGEQWGEYCLDCRPRFLVARLSQVSTLSFGTSATRAFCSAPNLGETVNTTLDPTAIVYVIDDDTQVRGGLANLLQSVGLQVEAFATTTEFLARAHQDVPQCLVLDVRLQGVSGLDFQAQLLSANINIPIIFITGHADIPMTVKAMKAGAIEFLTKPIREQDLLDAVQIALDVGRSRRKMEQINADLQARFKSLTSRERQVMTLVTLGKMNKHIAAEIGLSEITVKVHRSNLMKKMGARSIVDLVRMAESLISDTDKRYARCELYDLSARKRDVYGNVPMLEAEREKPQRIPVQAVRISNDRADKLGDGGTLSSTLLPECTR